MHVSCLRSKKCAFPKFVKQVLCFNDKNVVRFGVIIKTEYLTQSGLRAAMNSSQSMRPRPLRSNKSATAPISRRDVSNSEREGSV